MRIAAGLLLLATAALVWTVTPDGTFTVDGLRELLSPLRRHWWGPPASALGMALLLMLFAPMTPMVAALVLAHGPYVACAVGVAGTVLGAALGHTTGRFVLHDVLGDRLATSMPSLADHLRRRDLRASILIRLLPGAPFALMNALAGSAGVPLRYFLAGTALTALPIVAVMVWLSEGVLDALRSATPGQAVWWLVGAAVLVVALGFVARKLRR